MTPAIDWTVMCTYEGGIWRATAVGPTGASRPVRMWVSSTSVENARALLKAMIWLRCQLPASA